MSYVLSTRVDQPFDKTVATTRAALADNGFGVVTEVDLSDLLKMRIGVESPPQVILGACHPQLAHAALTAEPSIGLLLPCNVVVRELGDGETLVEALDPAAMVTLTGNAGLDVIAQDAREKLVSALVSLDGTLTSGDLGSGG